MNALLSMPQPVNLATDELLLPFSGARRTRDDMAFSSRCRLCKRQDSLSISLHPFQITCRNGCSRIGILRDAYAGCLMMSGSCEVLGKAIEDARQESGITGEMAPIVLFDAATGEPFVAHPEIRRA